MTLLGAFILAAAVSGAESTVSKEYQLKAAFLYNFTKFVEWPVTRFADAASPIVIGVLGRSPFDDELEKITQGRMVSGRAIVVKLVKTAEEVRTVHLLFVPSSEEGRLSTIAWQNSAIVAVGESDRFADVGGTITFTQKGDKLRFAINATTAERDGLKLSAQLLKLASAVHRN